MTLWRACAPGGRRKWALTRYGLICLKPRAAGLRVRVCACVPFFVRARVYRNGRLCACVYVFYGAFFLTVCGNGLLTLNYRHVDILSCTTVRLSLRWLLKSWRGWCEIWGFFYILSCTLLYRNCRSCILCVLRQMLGFNVGTWYTFFWEAEFQNEIGMLF